MSRYRLLVVAELKVSAPPKLAVPMAPTPAVAGTRAVGVFPGESRPAMLVVPLVVKLPASVLNTVALAAPMLTAPVPKAEPLVLLA